jgi:uncharacterized protein YhfF
VPFPVVDGIRSIEFGTPGESRRKLIDFVLNGNKRATAGLLKDYEAEGDLNAADFRDSHLAYWSKAGETISNDTQIVTVYFALLPEIIRRQGSSQ